jgi:hypothetical protein
MVDRVDPPCLFVGRRLIELKRPFQRLSPLVIAVCHDPTVSDAIFFMARSPRVVVSIAGARAPALRRGKAVGEAEA